MESHNGVGVILSYGLFNRPCSITAPIQRGRTGKATNPMGPLSCISHGEVKRMTISGLDIWSSPWLVFMTRHSAQIASWTTHLCIATWPSQTLPRLSKFTETIWATCLRWERNTTPAMSWGGLAGSMIIISCLHSASDLSTEIGCLGATLVNISLGRSKRC